MVQIPTHYNYRTGKVTLKSDNSFSNPRRLRVSYLSSSCVQHADGGFSYAELHIATFYAGDSSSEPKIICEYPGISTVVYRAEVYLSSLLDPEEDARFLSRKATWRNEPATEKQAEILLGHPELFDSDKVAAIWLDRTKAAPLRSLSRGEADDAIVRLACGREEVMAKSKKMVS